MAIRIGESWSAGATARRWGKRAVRWHRAAVNLLFPPRCALCDADLGDSEDELLLCQGCQEEMAPHDWSTCPRCGAHWGTPARPETQCPACRGTRFSFDAVVPLGSYGGVLREAVLKMKRASGEPLSGAAGELLLRRRGGRIASLGPDMVIPIPMHWQRRWVRRTNSPDLLADRLAKSLCIPLLDRALRRCRNTLPQKDLPPRDRFENVRDAFRVAARSDLRGAGVLLVDDVLTTGATCNEAARLLKNTCGAKMVFVAILARAEGDDGQHAP
jgi:ComF family protein